MLQPKEKVLRWFDEMFKMHSCKALVFGASKIDISFHTYNPTIVPPL
jgi:hypothetical protein